jgi:hypothetical protein
VLRDTPSSAASVRVAGSAAPGRNAPLTIAARSDRVICTTSGASPSSSTNMGAAGKRDARAESPVGLWTARGRRAAGASASAGVPKLGWCLLLQKAACSPGFLVGGTGIEPVTSTV